MAITWLFCFPSSPLPLSGPAALALLLELHAESRKDDSSAATDSTEKVLFLVLLALVKQSQKINTFNKVFVQKVIFLACVVFCLMYFRPQNIKETIVPLTVL